MEPSLRIAVRAVSLAVALLTGAIGSAELEGDLDCGDFGSRAVAQAHLDAHPTDPDGLDGNSDGVACEDHDYVGESEQGIDPAIGTPSKAATPRALASPVGGSPTPDAAPGDLDCADFGSREAAQATYDADPSDPNGLDRNNNGHACEDHDY